MTDLKLTRQYEDLIISEKDNEPFLGGNAHYSTEESLEIQVG